MPCHGSPFDSRQARLSMLRALRMSTGLRFRLRLRSLTGIFSRKGSQDEVLRKAA